jgi:phosphoribosyl 1,2-cyclic phosphodiesterase
MRFASLGSGSQGNALVVEAAGRTRVLLDCGFSLKETMFRLARLALRPEDLSAVILTHEHDDHAGGIAALARRFRIPVWLTHGTLKASGSEIKALPELRLVGGSIRFAIGDLELEPYTVPHDAREPVQYVFGDGAVKLGVLTDCGSSTQHIEATLTGCHALVLECNHDASMLENGSYPASLKRRIAGRFGHMDNETSASLLSRLDCRRLKHVIAAHLSRHNNTSELARSALARALNCKPEWVGVADQDLGFSWREVV